MQQQTVGDSLASLSLVQTQDRFRGALSGASAAGAHVLLQSGTAALLVRRADARETDQGDRTA